MAAVWLQRGFARGASASHSFSGPHSSDPVNPMSPGDVAEVRYPPGGKLLVHRLGGSNLRRARRVDVALLDRKGRSLSRFDDVPFDPTQGEVLVACQSHFADLFPHDTVFRLEVVLDDGREESSYTILHRV